MDAAAIVFGKIDAGIVWTAFEHESLAIRRDFGLIINERLLAQAEEVGNALNLGFAHPDDSVLYPATSTATLTDEVFHFRSCNV